MIRKFFLLFLLFIIVSGLGVWGYFVWNDFQYDNSASNISESSRLEKLSFKTIPHYSPDEPINFNQKIMQKTVDNIDNKQLKKAIILQPSTLKSNVSETGFQKNNFRFDSQAFQSLFLQLISKKLNFLNLKLEFRYYENFQKVKVKISDSDNPNNKIFKNFQMQYSK